MPDKKYKLFKADGSNGDRPPCAFFFSPEGCRNGDNCKFSHKLPSNKADTSTAALVEDSSDVVSSESEDETPKQQQQKQTKGKQNENKKNTPDNQQKATPKKANNNATPNSTPQESNKKRKRSKGEVNATDFDSDLGLFCKPIKRTKETKDVDAKENTPKSKSNQATTPKSSTKKKAQKVAKSIPIFRALNLPIASFNTETGEVGHTQPSATPTYDEPSTGGESKPKYPLPKSTPEGLTWQSAVVNTRSNPKYESVYDFDKMKKQEEENGVTNSNDWFKARPYGSWCSKNPHAIAIDCEMCETKDPETGNSDHKALCRLSVVNALNPEEVLLDTLVKPVWPVVDYRTRINGIKKENLDIVEFTLKHAQAFMMALCSEETVILGHALHNDLAAIKMEHHCNVDSALLFKCKDAAETATCSLKDLAKSVTGKEMPNIHCSVNDARTALICLKDGYLDKDCKPNLVERSVKKPPRNSTELFVHRIPKGCKTEHIKNMFLSYTSIVPDEVPDITYGADTGKTTVSFTSPEHANLAFRTFESEEKPDKTGRMQKRIYLRNGDYAYVRKMTMDRKKKVTDNATKTPLLLRTG